MPKTRPLYQTFTARYEYHYLATPSNYCEVGDFIDILDPKDKQTLIKKLEVVDYLYRPEKDTLPPPDSFCRVWFGCEWVHVQSIVKSRYIGVSGVQVIIGKLC
jgi:hypothetical protein